MTTTPTFEQLVELPNHRDLLAEPGRFFQCGSRWFADRYPDIIQVKETTDWDFYCHDSEHNHDRLLELGFHRVAEHNGIYPLDDLAVAIYAFADVQVIVRTDAARYSKTILRIDPEFYRDYLWKSGPNKPERVQIQRIFNQLFKMAK